MTSLQALYGSQYSEIAARGKDGNKGRYNGNVFLSAFLILALLNVMMIWLIFVPGADESLADNVHTIFGVLSGKTVGQVLAIPLFALIYVIVSKTVGSEENFQKHVAAFNQLPAAIKTQANKRLLIPFFILLGLLFALSMTSL